MSKLPPKRAAGALQDRCGVQIIGDDAEVWVSASTKLSKDYQSAGVEVGIRFRTAAAGIDVAVAAATAKVRAAALEETRTLLDAVIV